MKPGRAALTGAERAPRSRIIPGLPPTFPGLRIGLYGGTFDPPHAGHQRVSLLALRRLRLDQVWWLVTPGNPLKRNAGLPSQTERMAAAARLADHPRLVVTGLEARLGTRYTAAVAERLQQRLPGVRFVLLIGSDNLAAFHRWKDWRRLMATVPIAVINRPGSLLSPLSARAAQAFASARIDAGDAALLPVLSPPAWTFLVAPRSALSSTSLRRKAGLDR